MSRGESYYREERKIKKLIATIFNLCELSGYRVESRIILKNVKTGKKWGGENGKKASNARNCTRG